ncbi:MAG: RecX family transcriptional regulator [Bacteroidales bacterium]|nr:RecX family transcriptional regulator [Bacteroidales bacterium]
MDSQQARTRLMAECSRKEISARQARQWLIKHDIPESETKQIVNSLVKDKYIDDSRFAKAYTRDKLRFSKWGPEKILQGLGDAGIDKSIAEKTVKEEESLAIQILSDLLSKKQKELEKKQEKRIAETQNQIELLKDKLGDIETQKERASLQRKIYTLQTKIRSSNQQTRSALMAFALRKGFSLKQISSALKQIEI